MGHSTAGVIDVTEATSTIRGELVDVRQCHGAQWNIHRSAFRLPFWLPGWLALIFLCLYTPLTIKRTHWVAHVTEGDVAQGVWGETVLGQATCKPKSCPKRPLVTSYLPQHQKRHCSHGWVPSRSSESFKYAGEHIWQPLSVSLFFFFFWTSQSVK